ncbi:hypothetical protein DPV78_008733 [Talaromyces pinophilus]|nr:hypothetical protein DPV78_008733 [Talaromyces pinophilus]
MAYTLSWAISTWIVNLTVCIPIAYYYDRTIKGGSCKNQAISGSVNGALSLLGDIFILVLPVPMMWHLKMNTRRKIGISGIFLLGCFTCIASTIRIVELTRFVPTDATYSQVYSSTWTDLEMGVAVISGNLPLLAPVFERFLGRNASTRRYYYYYYGSSGRDGPTSLSSTPHNFERFKDTDQHVRPRLGDMELDDRAILVKTQVDVVSYPADSGSETRATIEGETKHKKWLQTM